MKPQLSPRAWLRDYIVATVWPLLAGGGQIHKGRAERAGGTAAGIPDGTFLGHAEIADADLVAGQVVKSVAGGHITKASGGAGPTSANAGDGDGDLVKGVAYPAASAGELAKWYPTGTQIPIAGLPVGPIYRSHDGLLVPGSSLVDSEWTNQIGISDGTKLDVLVSPPFQWSTA